MKVLRRIDVKSSAKVMGAFYVVSGAMIFITAAILLFISDPTSGGECAVIIVGGTIFYSILGLISGFFGAFIYNFIAKYICGIEYEVETM